MCTKDYVLPIIIVLRCASDIVNSSATFGEGYYYDPFDDFDDED